MPAIAWYLPLTKAALLYTRVIAILIMAAPFRASTHVAGEVQYTEIQHAMFGFETRLDYSKVSV